MSLPRTLWGASPLPADLRAEIDAEMARVDPDRAPHVPGLVYGRRLAQRRTKRRAAGTYYTPPHLVDFIVDRTLGPLVDGGVDPLSLRVLDPACGGGVFLLGALDWLARRAGPGHAARIARHCLFGVDLDPVAVEVCRLAVRLAAGDEPNLAGDEPHIATGNALVGDFPIGGRFDAVVGNPPWGQKGFTWDPDDKAWVRGHYACGRGVLDPYALFVERATELADRWGMVLPDIILLKNQQDIRDLILDRCAIEWIADSQRAFPGAAIDTVVIVARRGDGCGHSLSAWHSLPERWRDCPPPTVSIPQSLFGELPGHKFNIRLTPEARALWRRLDALPRFGDRFEAHEGVHSGNSRAKLFVTEQANDACVPLILGRGELSRGRVEWGGARWLNLSSDAIDREAGDYAHVGRREWYERPKILVRRTGDRVVAAFDGDGYYCSNNMFVVLPREIMSDDRMRAYVTVLNSRLLTWYFRTVQPRAGRLFPELKINHLLAFPIPDGVEDLVGVPESMIDRAVFALYGLTDAEIALVGACED